MLYDDIVNDVTNALKNHDETRKLVLRSVISDVKNLTVNAGKEITDDVVLKCIQKSVKQHNDSISQFEKAGRTDLAEKEKNELAVLSSYLPKMISEDDTKKIIDEITANIEPVKKNMGMIMKSLPSSVDKKIAVKYLNTILK